MVEAYCTGVLEQLTPADVQEVADKVNASPDSEHALGTVTNRVAARHPEIADWNPDFAFVHLLHLVMQDAGRLLTWSELVKRLQAPPFRHMLWAPAQTYVIHRSLALAGRATTGSGQDVEARAAELAVSLRQAMRWRVGNVYYSFLREQFVWAVLGQRVGLVRQHPLADALFKTDAWVGDVNLDLFIVNERYRDGRGLGRKVPGPSLLADARPAFTTVELRLPTQHSWGQVHLPSVAVVERAADGISAALEARKA